MSVDEVVGALAAKWARMIIDHGKHEDDMRATEARMDGVTFKAGPDTITISGPTGYDKDITLVGVDYTRETGGYYSGLVLQLDQILGSDPSDKSEEGCKKHHEGVCAALGRAAEIASDIGPHKVIYEKSPFKHQSYLEPDAVCSTMIMLEGLGENESMKRMICPGHNDFDFNTSPDSYP